MTTTTRRDGVLTIANGRLCFEPEVYPVEHLRNEGWRKEADGSWTTHYSTTSAARLAELFPKVEFNGWLLAPQLQPAGPMQVGTGTAQQPASWGRLFSYQKRAAEWLTQRRSAILCLSPGLGKTATALIAAQMAFPKQNLEVVIVAPLTLLLTWERELKRWWPEAVSRFQGEQPNQFSDSWPPIVSIVTYDYLRRHGLPRTNVDLLIFDESVLLKNRKAARTKAAALARKQAKVCWLLSGAPTTRFYDDLWAQLHVLEPKMYSSYWRFCPKYTLISDTIWGRQIVANVPGIEPTLKRDLAPIFFSYSYSDLAREEPERAIPEWIFETRQVPLPEKWWRLYKQMQDKFVADLPDGERVLAPNTLARLVRLLQLASHPALLVQGDQTCRHCKGRGYLPGNDELLECPYCPVDGEEPDFSGYDWNTKGGKLSVLPELLEELPGPTILWTTFIETAKHLTQLLKAPCLIGETPAEERTRIVADFQAGEYPVLIAHPGVGRFGLTLTRGRSSIYVERDYQGDNWVQSLARIRRIGTVEPPRVVTLEATGPNGEPTVDRLIGFTLDYRLQKATAITAAAVRDVLG